MKRLFILAISLLAAVFALFSCDTKSNEESSSDSGITIEVRYEAQEGGSIIGEAIQSAKVDEGSSHTFEQIRAEAQEGYVFKGWSDGCTDAVRQDTLSQSTAFTALFESDGLVKIEYRVEGGGSISGGELIQRIEPDSSTVKITAKASDGYRFTGWSDGKKSVSRTDIATEDATYTAIFKKVHTVTFVCDESMGTIDGLKKQGILDGTSTKKITVSANSGYKFVGWSNGEVSETIQFTPSEDITITAIFEREALELPILSVYTENCEKITSKEIYLDCTVSVENAPEAQLLTNSLARIRGRGNTSFEVDKASYKLKFDDPVSLFGNQSAREWTLISNHFDLSLIRNYLAYSVASKFDALGSTTTTQFVELYLNGEYRGVYLVCEQIEVGSGRVEITKGFDSVDTGYLIEMDGREDGDGFYMDDEFYVIKSPDTDSALYTDAHTAFIESYLRECMDAALGDDYSKIEALIDTESFAQAYIVFELFNCVDVGYSSFYMYKDASGKLFCGPVWDFDRSCGNVRNNEDARRYDSLWAKQSNVWFNALLEHEEFYELVCTRLKEYLPKISNALNECYSYVESCDGSFNRNFERWDILGTWVWPNPDELLAMESWQEQVDFVKLYLNNSLTFLLRTYAK